MSPPPDTLFPILASQIIGRTANPTDSSSSSSSSVLKLLNEDDPLCDDLHGPGEVGDLVYCDVTAHPLIGTSLLSSTTTSPPTTIPELTFSNLALTIGDSEVPPSLELSLRYLKNDEPLVIRATNKYSRLGKSANDTTTTGVEYSITPKRIIKQADIPDSAEHILARTTTKKALGNTNFAATEYIRALKLYGAAAEQANQFLASSSKDRTDPTFSPLQTVLISATNNIALTQFKLGDYLKSKDACIEVLKFDDMNVKATIRASLCCIELGDYGEAKTALGLGRRRAGEEEGKNINNADDDEDDDNDLDPVRRSQPPSVNQQNRPLLPRQRQRRR